MPSDDYYDTVQFSEDYTGYDGRDVWSFIHDRIGFHEGDMATDKYDADSVSTFQFSPATATISFNHQFVAQTVESRFQ